MFFILSDAEKYVTIAEGQFTYKTKAYVRGVKQF